MLKSKNLLSENNTHLYELVRVDMLTCHLDGINIQIFPRVGDHNSIREISTLPEPCSSQGAIRW